MFPRWRSVVADDRTTFPWIPNRHPRTPVPLTRQTTPPSRRKKNGSLSNCSKQWWKRESKKKKEKKFVSLLLLPFFPLFIFIVMLACAFLSSITIIVEELLIICWILVNRNIELKRYNSVYKCHLIKQFIIINKFTNIGYEVIKNFEEWICFGII